MYPCRMTKGDRVDEQFQIVKTIFLYVGKYHHDASASPAPSVPFGFSPSRCMTA